MKKILMIALATTLSLLGIASAQDAANPLANIKTDLELIEKMLAGEVDKEARVALDAETLGVGVDVNPNKDKSWFGRNWGWAVPVGVGLLFLNDDVQEWGQDALDDLRGKDDSKKVKKKSNPHDIDDGTSNDVIVKGSHNDINFIEHEVDNVFIEGDNNSFTAGRHEPVVPVE